MPETRQVTFRVFRYKAGDVSPRYQTFSLSVTPRTTVLHALEEIRTHQDPTLAFRHSCFHASCGTCGMRINGREALACLTRVWDLGTDKVTLEPLADFPVLADLVVDVRAFYARFAPVGMPLIRESEALPQAELSEDLERYTRYENCIECGLCLSACPITGTDSSYLGPAPLAAVERILAEPRGQEARIPELLRMADGAHGVWRCHLAFECTEVCPSDVDPGGAIMRLRRRLIFGGARR